MATVKIMYWKDIPCSVRAEEGRRNRVIRKLPDVYMAVVDAVANLSSDGTCTGFGLQNVDARLGPFTDNGGLDSAYPLLPGSPAIDAGQDSSCAPIDEREVTRPMLHHCDMGAYESHGVNLGAISGGGQSTPLLTAFPDPLIISVTGYDEEPVNGGRVYLNLPSSGASAIPASPTVPVAGGQASMTFTANGIVGSYYIGFYTYGSDDLVSAHYMTNTANPDVVFIFLPLVIR